MMRTSVAVVGGCQIGGIGYALKFCSPSFDVRFINAARPNVDGEELAVDAASSDIVVTMNVGPPEIHYENMVRRHENVHLVPVFVFSGLHPDCTMFLDHEKPTRAVLGTFHSALAAMSYVCGLSVARTERLFNALLYRALGYFNQFDASRAFVAHQYAKAGLNIDNCFDQWMSAGPFMYTPNHPRGDVLADIGEILSVKLGAHERNLGTMRFSDNLRGLGIWPCYPELARLKHQQGSLTFLVQMEGELQELPLCAFIDESFKRFSEIGGDSLLTQIQPERLDIFKMLVK